MLHKTRFCSTQYLDPRTAGTRIAFWGFFKPVRGVWGILCLLRTDAFCDAWHLSDISRSVADQISDVAVFKCILFSSSPISMILILIKMKAIQTISINFTFHSTSNISQHQSRERAELLLKYKMQFYIQIRIWLKIFLTK